jgi:ribosomal protein S27AE
MSFDAEEDQHYLADEIDECPRCGAPRLMNVAGDIIWVCQHQPPADPDTLQELWGER